MKTLLTANLTTKTAGDGGTVWTPPVYTFGESLTLALRFLRSDDGNLITPVLDLRGVTAALGPLDARPVTGEWALQLGAGAQTVSNTTGTVPHEATAKQLQDAINALSVVTTLYGTAVVRKDEGSWFIQMGTGAVSIPMTVRDNTLAPDSYGRCLARQIDGVWQHEVRLTQVPAAFADSYERVLPDPPSITRIRAGGTSGDYAWNEVQALYVPPDFLGNYALKRDYARTALLSVEDDADAIQAALVAVLGENVSVLEVAGFTAHVEFTGELGGQALALLEVEPLNPPPGDVTFTLALDRDALLARLRSAPSVTLPLEVRITTADEEDVETEQVAFRTLLTVQRPVIFPDLALVPAIDWLRPPSPNDYVPFSLSSFVVGHQFFRAVVGNGSATSFTLAHGLATDDTVVFGRLNTSGGRQLIHGTDFTVVFTNSNSCVVTVIGTAPATNAWVLTVMSEQTVEAFAAGLTVTIGQVTGLDARLLAVETRVGSLETLLPSGTLTRPAVSGTAAEIEIPDNFVIYPNLRLGPDFDAGSIAALSAQLVRTFPAAAVRPPGLLPAIRDTSVTTFTSADLPGSPSVGNVYQNTGAAAVLVPGGLGRRGRALAVNEYAGWDGRVWYHVTRGSASSTSFFPTDFHEEMIAPITFERDTWRAAQQFVVEFDLAVQLLRASSNAQWLLVIEHGAVPSETDATATAIDLTTAGTGTHTAYFNGTALGTFTANATTNVLTLTGTPPADGDVLQVANAGGALPGGLLALTDYVVRDYTAGTFKLAPLTTTLSLRDVEWNPTPMLTQRLAVSALRQTRRFGCRVLRSAANVMSAEQMKSAAWSVADSTPATPRFALRVRLIDFDTENSVTGATGYAWAGLTAATASITS